MARVAVLYGGWSAERPVSQMSGKAVEKALRSRGHDAYLVDVTRDLPALIRALDPRPDVVFNALHGQGGEDGTIQGVLDMLGLPYTHSGVLASAIAMSKPVTKRLLEGLGVRTPRGIVVPRDEVATRHVLPPPYVVKPAAEGSSFGVRIVRENDNVPPIEAGDWTFGEEVLVEEYIGGRDLTVGVMGDRALTVTEIRHDHGFFDYDAKYISGHARHILPAAVPQEVFDEAMRIALLAHRTVGCRGVSRSDFVYDDRQPGTEGLYFLEINNQPGFTPMSLVPEQAEHMGIGFAELCEWLVENASCSA